MGQRLSGFVHMLQAEFQEQQVSQPKDKHLLTFPMFHWPKQVIRPCHIEGLERHSSPWEEQWSRYKGVDTGRGNLVRFLKLATVITAKSLLLETRLV